MAKRVAGRSKKAAVSPQTLARIGRDRTVSQARRADAGHVRHRVQPAVVAQGLCQLDGPRPDVPPAPFAYLATGALVSPRSDYLDRAAPPRFDLDESSAKTRVGGSAVPGSADPVLAKYANRKVEDWRRSRLRKGLEAQITALFGASAAWAPPAVFPSRIRYRRWDLIVPLKSH
jgi:hypothetical protein